MPSITLEHVLVWLTGRKFFEATRWPPLYIGDTFAVLILIPRKRQANPQIVCLLFVHYLAVLLFTNK